MVEVAKLHSQSSLNEQRAASQTIITLPGSLSRRYTAPTLTSEVHESNRDFQVEIQAAFSTRIGPIDNSITSYECAQVERHNLDADCV